jgi:hypothetical protein
MVLSSPSHIPLVMHSKSKEATEVASVYGQIQCSTIYESETFDNAQAWIVRAINGYEMMRAMVTYVGITITQRDRMPSRVRRVGSVVLEFQDPGFRCRPYPPNPAQTPITALCPVSSHMN